MISLSWRRTAVPGLLLLGTVGGVWLLRHRKAATRAALVRLALEYPAQRSFTDLGQQLEQAGTLVDRRLGRAKDTPRNREVTRHIIGMERWGQRRLQVMRGDVAFIKDGHRPYRPPEASLAELRQEYSRTRAQTVELSYSLVGRVLKRSAVEHNAFGPLSARAWLRYLRLHAEVESRKLRLI